MLGTPIFALPVLLCSVFPHPVSPQDVSDELLPEPPPDEPILQNPPPVLLLPREIAARVVSQYPASFPIKVFVLVKKTHAKKRF